MTFPLGPSGTSMPRFRRPVNSRLAFPELQQIRRELGEA